MSKYQVNTQEMNNTIGVLAENNNEFRSRVQELVSLQQELASMWQGDANVAFNNAFTTDQGKWESFATLVDQYIEALRTIMQVYIQAESINTETATNRTY